jgi:hypothetical protein
MPDTVVAASLTLDSKQANQSVASFKAELKAAQQDVINLTDKFGATSKATIEAAKRAAELKDRIGDAKKLVDSFNPDEKFRGFTQVLTGVAGGFSAITGTMNLLGIQSEDTQKKLLQVQSLLAVTSGLNSFGDSIQSVKNFGATLVKTLGKEGLIGLAVAGVAALTASFLGLFDGAEKATEAQKSLVDTTKDYANAAAGAIQNVNKVQLAFDLARDGVISKEKALKTYNETLGDSLGRTNDINEAERLFAEKSETYIKVVALRAKANALAAISAQKSAEALIEEATTGEKKVQALGRFFGEIIDDAAKKRKAKKEEDAKAILDLSQSVNAEAKALSDAAKIKTDGGKTTPAKSEIETKIDRQIDFGAIYNAIIQEQAIKDAEDLKAINDAVNVQELIDQQAMDDQMAGLDTTATDLAKLQSSLRVQNAQAESAAKVAISKTEADQRLLTAEFVAGRLSLLADAAGKQTTAGKILAIASATINTYLAASKALAGDYSIYGPAGPFVRVATVISTIGLGLKQINEIRKVQVPGGGGGGGVSAPALSPSFSAPQAPLAPTPQVQTTRLDQQSLNSVGNAAFNGTMRAYVLDSDIADNRERVERLNRAARLGG